MRKIIYIILIVAVIFLGNYLYRQGQKNPTVTEVVATSTESTTTVPVDTTGATTTKSVTDIVQGISYNYPDNFYFENKLTDYVHPVDWPPKVEVKKEKLVCKTTDKSNQSKKIEGNTYCLTIEAEGAAGSTYTTYTYKRQFTDKVVAITFVTRVPQCMNYDEPKQSACKNEVANFSIDNMVNTIFNSVTFQK